MMIPDVIWLKEQTYERDILRQAYGTPSIEQNIHARSKKGVEIRTSVIHGSYIIKRYVENVVIGSLVQFRSTIKFSTEKLLALQDRHDLPNTIRYGYSRSDNKPHIHFVCAGAPMHSSPANQELAGHIYARLRYYTRLYRFITTVL